MTTEHVQHLIAPTVSVVLVTRNAWAWTRRALDALREHTPPVFELIVVDNASTDGTMAGLVGIEGATVIRNTSNVGFGPACNQGASAARGRYIVLLNSDALVHRGWLDPMLQIADAEPDVAAVAPRLLHLDGRLQEAGSILWRDGSVLNYGDGDRADRPEYSFRRDVDYASAACLLVRRSSFTSVGGFDPVYAPAYCEDVDLCLAFAARGWRVVFQPRSTVTHARWGSGNSAAAAELLARNRPVLVKRWRTVLDKRPPESWYRHPPAVIGGRDAMTCERVLVLASRVPSPGDPNTGGEAELLRDARRRWPRLRLTLVGIGDDPSTAAWAALPDDGIEVASGAIDWADWLRNRRYHYGVVVTFGNPHPLAAVVATTQPQAWRIDATAAQGAMTQEQRQTLLTRLARAAGYAAA